mgnify:CR=1 FL=1
MAVFRVEKTNDYTVMANHHLRNHALSLKAKGLLSQMLSLPEDWDYTLSGLAEINRESKDAIRAAVQELEQAGYIQRRQTQDKGGKFAGNEYVIREIPCPPDTDSQKEPPEASGEPLLENPTTEKPSTEKPSTEKPSPENPTQLNKDIQSKDIKEKNKKEKPGLGEPALRQLFAQKIREAQKPDWTRTQMNGLYQSLVDLYDPGRQVRKARPMRTEASVNRTFAKLAEWHGSDIQGMIDTVETAIANGWQGVQPPNGYQRGRNNNQAVPGWEVEYPCV